MIDTKFLTLVQTSLIGRTFHLSEKEYDRWLNGLSQEELLDQLKEAVCNALDKHLTENKNQSNYMPSREENK